MNGLSNKYIKEDTEIGRDRNKGRGYRDGTKIKEERYRNGEIQRIHRDI